MMELVLTKSGWLPVLSVSFMCNRYVCSINSDLLCFTAATKCLKVGWPLGLIGQQCVRL